VEVRLVEDPRTRREQVDEADLRDELVGRVTGPGQERGVRLEDEPVLADAEVPARCSLVECLRVVDEEGSLERCPSRVVGGDVRVPS